MSTADTRSFHMSALSTAHALMHLANHVLAEAARAAAGTDAAASFSQEVAHVMDSLEQHMWALQLNPAAEPSSETACHNKAPAGDTVQFVPRHPCVVQHLADTMSSDADSEYMLVLALSLAGRSAVEVVMPGGCRPGWACPPLGMGLLRQPAAEQLSS